MTLLNLPKLIESPKNLKIGDLTIDFSYSIMNLEKYENELVEKLKEEGLINNIKSLFGDNELNKSEGRSEDHVALRDSNNEYQFTISNEIKEVEKKQNKFVSQFHQALELKKYEAVIVLGVGGSSLGLHFVCKTLEANLGKKIDYCIADNIDSYFVNKIKELYDLSKCLFIVSSKTFTTLETMTLASVFKKELISSQNKNYNWNKNFIAITSNQKLALEFGLAKEHIFKFWESISGRFSIWSAIGMPLDLIFGANTHKNLKEGANQIDNAFYSDISAKNPILQYAFMQYSNLKVYNSKAESIVAYDSTFEKFINYLQQLYMESLGKAYTKDNKAIEHTTCPLIFGGVGTNDQHSYFQLLHQGRQIVPVTFIEIRNKEKDEHKLQFILNKNLEAQRSALFQGRKENSLPLARQFEGQQPSVKISLNKVTPNSIGQLMAFYEHVVFTMSQFNKLNCFDQWGVELGKEIYHSK